MPKGYMLEEHPRPWRINVHGLVPTIGPGKVMPVPRGILKERKNDSGQAPSCKPTILRPGQKL